MRSVRFWVGWSLLAHAVLVGLIYYFSNRTLPLAPPPLSNILTVQMVTAPRPLPPPPAVTAEIQPEPAIVPKPRITEPSKKMPAAKVPDRDRTTARAAATMPAQGLATTPVADAAAVAGQLDLTAVLSAANQQAATRALTSTELAQLQQRTGEEGPTVTKPASDPHLTSVQADVLQTLDDGRQLVRVGDGCAIADVGADLRKDIHSIRWADCGKDADAQMYERIMAKVGQGRQ